MSKILIIGLDGATWDVLNEWIEGGYLPNIKKLKENGTFSNLESTVPTITATAWTSFLTGMEPSNSGIFGFNDRNTDYSVYINNSSAIKAETLWQYLSRYGMRSIFVNVPMTYPASSFNGYMITGLLTPSKESRGFTYPEDLFTREYMDKNTYMIRIKLPEYSEKYNDLIRDLKLMIKKRLEVTLRLIEKPWDLFMVHFYATDIAQHAFWKFIDENHPQYDEKLSGKYGSSLKEIFIEIDNAIGKLLNVVDVNNTNIFLISDHGFGTNKHTIQINKWLKKIGMLSLYPPVSLLITRTLKKLSAKTKLSFLNSFFNMISELILLSGYLIPKEIQKETFSFLERCLSRFKKLSFLFKRRGYKAIFEGINWDKTYAYSIGTTGRIYINLKGRESRGIVSSKNEYKKVVNFIKGKLLDIRNSSGIKIINGVYLRDEIYKGRFKDRAPDLIPDTEGEGLYFYPFFDRKELITGAEEFRSGNHRINGIFLASGPAILEDKEVNYINITDITPTVLYMMGMDMGDKMDGRIITDIFKKGYLRKHEIVLKEKINYRKK